MDPITSLGLGGVIVYLFLDKMFAYLKSRDAKQGGPSNGNGGNAYERDRAREREMGQLIERVANLSSMKDVVATMQERIGGLAENVQALSTILANDIRDIKQRLNRLEGNTQP